MKQLKPEQIIPYLPYRLKVMMEGKVCNVAWMSTKNIAVIRPHTLGEIKKIKWEYVHLNVKPILRPLSDLTKEIEYNGKIFIPEKALSAWDLRGLNKSHTPHMPVNLCELFLEWHFDTYGLIDKGLAIDINTLGK